VLLRILMQVRSGAYRPVPPPVEEKVHQ
jgi:hypothetical protein